MKHLFLFLAIGMLFVGCAKDPDNNLRIINTDSQSINNLSIGSVSFGDVNPNSTTSYKHIDEGTHNISGMAGTSSLTGTCTISGNGTHNWTLTLNSSGKVDFTEDK